MDRLRRGILRHDCGAYGTLSAQDDSEDEDEARGMVAIAPCPGTQARAYQSGI
jgi:hypothetical protein